MSENIGQETETWDDFWDGLTPESEIRMWDYYGGRLWILKYTPRFGKVIEAGCGLGRYNFYLANLGIDIVGLDFSKPIVKFLNDWACKNKYNNKFITGDVTKLPYKNNSLRGYISLGVVEHFIEGPQLPLKEAYRVLLPGGIAIITTPSVSFSVLIKRIRNSLRIKYKTKRLIKKLLGYPIAKKKFFQYEYRPRKLKHFIEKAGFHVSHYSGTDLMYPFCELYKYNFEKCKTSSFAHRFADKYENTFLRTIGAQSITIGVKVADIMYCFFCGELKATKDSLINYDVPICNNCINNNINTNLYIKYKQPYYATPYIIEPTLLKPTMIACDFCGKAYTTDVLFENFGFTKNVCPDCLQNPIVNIELSNKYVKHIWRKRIATNDK